MDSPRGQPLFDSILARLEDKFCKKKEDKRKRVAFDPETFEPPAKKAKGNNESMRVPCNYSRNNDNTQRLKDAIATAKEAGRDVAAIEQTLKDHENPQAQRRSVRQCSKCRLWCCNQCMPRKSTTCFTCETS